MAQRVLGNCRGNICCTLRARSIPSIAHHPWPPGSASRRQTHRFAPSSKRDHEKEPDLSELVELGVFGGTHGVRGEMKLQTITDAVEERLLQPGRRWATVQGARRRQPLRELEITGLRDTVSKGRDVWLVKVKGVDSIEEAQLLQGHTLLMLAADRPQLEADDEFYVQELVGMKVVLQSSKKLVGTVVDVFSGTGTHDLLRIELNARDDSPEDEPRTALVPFASEIVPAVHRGSRVMEINPPEGLLNIRELLKNSTTMASTTKKRQRRKSPKADTGSPEGILQCSLPAQT